MSPEPLQLSPRLLGPYPPVIAGPGGVPSTMPDVPISAFFIVLFAYLAAANIAIILANRRQKRAFPISGMLLGFW